jgi:hypothetical protein
MAPPSANATPGAHMSDSHGHTTAAWTAVIIMLIGFTIAGVALPLAEEWLFFVGLGVVALGAVVGKVMQMMGLGNTVSYEDERDPDYDERGETDASGERADERDDRATDARRPAPENVDTTRG